MSLTGHYLMIGMLVLGVVIGWSGCLLWDRFMDWMYDVTQWTGGWLVSLFAMIGVGTVCVGIAWWITK